MHAAMGALQHFLGLWRFGSAWLLRRRRVAALLLAYVGSRFVLEVVLHRGLA
jgi:ABC-type uncharacterized transport system permease subunit